MGFNPARCLAMNAEICKSSLNYVNDVNIDIDSDCSPNHTDCQSLSSKPFSPQPAKPGLPATPEVIMLLAAQTARGDPGTPEPRSLEPRGLVAFEPEALLPQLRSQGHGRGLKGPDRTRAVSQYFPNGFASYCHTMCYQDWRSYCNTGP